MKRRLAIGFGLLLALLMVGILAVPDSRLTIFGYLRGENRFQGRPTSYWQFKVERYASQNANPTARRVSYWDKILNFLSITNSGSRPEKPTLLVGKSEALPVLIVLIKDKTNKAVALEAHKALGTLGEPSAKDVLPLLEEEINGQDMYFRTAAVHTLAGFGREGIPLLIQALKHESPDVRIAAAQTLMDMGYGPKNLVPRNAVLALLEALKDEAAEVRAWSARALATIDPEEADEAHVERFIPGHPGFLGRVEGDGNPP